MVPGFRCMDNGGTNRNGEMKITFTTQLPSANIYMCWMWKNSCFDHRRLIAKLIVLLTSRINLSMAERDYLPLGSSGIWADTLLVSLHRELSTRRLTVESSNPQQSRQWLELGDALKPAPGSCSLVKWAFSA